MASESLQFQSALTALRDEARTCVEEAKGREGKLAFVSDSYARARLNEGFDPLGSPGALDEECVSREIETIVPEVQTERPAEKPGTVCLALDLSDRLESTQENGVGHVALSSHNVQTMPNAIDKIHIGKARRTKHGFVSRAPVTPRGVRGEVLWPLVGFCFHDAPDKATGGARVHEMEPEKLARNDESIARVKRSPEFGRHECPKPFILRVHRVQQPDYFSNHALKMRFPWRLYHGPIVESLGRAIGSSPGPAVLNIGSGPFFELSSIDVGDRTMTICDIEPRAVELARELHGKKITRADVVEPDAPLPYEDGSFDLVVSMEVIEHTSDPVAWTKEALRVLRPGGALFLTTPNYDSLSLRLLETTALELVARLQGFSRKYIHPTKMTHARLADVLAQAGASDARLETISLGWVLAARAQRV